MKKLILSLSISLGLFSCSKSPESAAKEVCDCYKQLSDTKLSEIGTKTKECTELASKFGGQFKDEDLKKYSLGIADCATGGVFSK